MPISPLKEKRGLKQAEIPGALRRKIGRAMADYSMLADGDQVLVAVSGGIDSLVLTRVLQLWQRRAPIRYTLHCVHVDMEPGPDSAPGPAAEQVRAVLADMDLECAILPAFWRQDASDRPAVVAQTKDFCFQCARNRRTLLFAHARQKGVSLLALGHHRDDILETFVLNMARGGNLSTMLPRQDLFSGRLALVRPLAYLSKNEVKSLGQRFGLSPVNPQCPLSEQTSRRQVQKAIDALEAHLPDARATMFSALANLRPDYLLDARYRRPYANRA